MKKILLPAAACLLAILFTIWVYTFRVGGGRYLFLTDTLALVFSAAAVFFGVLALRRYTLKSLHGKSLAFIVAGISLWCLDEALFLIFNMRIWWILETIRIAAYLPITIGFFYILMVSHHKYRGQNKNIFAVIAIFLAFSLLYLFTVPSMFGGLSLARSITIYGYIIVDFILLFGIILLLGVSYAVRGGYMSTIWLIFVAAFLAVFLFDLYFAFNYLTYQMGDSVEILWLLNYLLLAVGFYFHYHVLDRVKALVS